MSSFRQLAAAHAPVLILDAAAAHVQAGFAAPDGTLHWARREEEAGTGVFACIRDLGVDPDSMNAFAFCEGPGSILGIRTVASALRVWQALQKRPVWAYKSLDLLAAGLGDPDALIISDARRDSWHVSQLGRSCVRIPGSQLPREGRLITPGGFRQWSKMPEGLSPEPIPYDLDKLMVQAADADLLHASEEPDAFLHEEPFYATWTPQIHRASP